MEEKYIEQSQLETEEQNNRFESTENQADSTFGRFKDAKTLLDAYTSLQAEFTRKCQKLADLQKEKEENAVFYKEYSLEELLKNEIDQEKYKKEVTEILTQNEELCNLPNKNLIAFKIAKNVEKEIESKLTNQEILEKYINDNNELKNKIISDYLLSLNNISSAPKIISGNSNNVFFSANENPKTLKDAGEIFSKMLN